MRDAKVLKCCQGASKGHLGDTQNPSVVRILAESSHFPGLVCFVASFGFLRTPGSVDERLMCKN